MSALIEEMKEEFRQEVLDCIKSRNAPVAVSTHIARELDEDYADVREALNQLFRRGDLNRMRAGQTKLYWPVESTDDKAEDAHEAIEEEEWDLEDVEGDKIGPCIECEKWIETGEKAVFVVEAVNHDGNLIFGDRMPHEVVCHRDCYKDVINE